MGTREETAHPCLSDLGPALAASLRQPVLQQEKVNIYSLRR